LVQVENTAHIAELQCNEGDDMHADQASSGSPAERPGFRVQVSAHDGVVVLSVEDVVDLLTAPSLSESINTALAPKPTALIVDLTDVTFLASAGMTILAKAQEQAGTATRFGVVADGSATSRPLKLLGLDQVLAIYPTLDEALREVR
jgi:anti-sigma B factor antagonist